MAETIKKTAFRITRMGQLVAQEASRRLDTPFGIVDLSLAPTPAVGDSVARILEAVSYTHLRQRTEQRMKPLLQQIAGAAAFDILPMNCVEFQRNFSLFLT